MARTRRARDNRTKGFRRVTRNMRGGLSFSSLIPGKKAATTAKGATTTTAPAAFKKGDILNCSTGTISKKYFVMTFNGKVSTVKGVQTASGMGANGSVSSYPVKSCKLLPKFAVGTNLLCGAGVLSKGTVVNVASQSIDRATGKFLVRDKATSKTFDTATCKVAENVGAFKVGSTVTCKNMVGLGATNIKITAVDTAKQKLTGTNSQNKSVTYGFSACKPMVTTGNQTAIKVNAKLANLLPIVAKIARAANLTLDKVLGATDYKGKNPVVFPGASRAIAGGGLSILPTTPVSILVFNVSNASFSIPKFVAGLKTQAINKVITGVSNTFEKAVPVALIEALKGPRTSSNPLVTSSSTGTNSSMGMNQGMGTGMNQGMGMGMNQGMGMGTTGTGTGTTGVGTGSCIFTRPDGTVQQQVLPYLPTVDRPRPEALDSEIVAASSFPGIVEGQISINNLRQNGNIYYTIGLKNAQYWGITSSAPSQTDAFSEIQNKFALNVAKTLPLENTSPASVGAIDSDTQALKQFLENEVKDDLGTFKATLAKAVAEGKPDEDIRLLKTEIAQSEALINVLNKEQKEEAETENLLRAAPAAGGGKRTSRNNHKYRVKSRKNRKYVR